MTTSAARSLVPRLRFSGVERRWGDRVAVDGVDIELAPGSRVAVIGPSGSGKTTLLRLAIGALKPTAGRVVVGDDDIADMSWRALRAHRRRCGFVDQGALVIPQLSVHRNVIAGMLPEWPWYRIAASIAYPLERERVRTILASVGLADRQWDRADQLSGGQQQRIAIARVIAAEPSLVFADEPTAALDPSTSREVLQLLVDQAAQRSATLLFSTHRISQIVEHVDRVIGLREGRVLFDIDADQITDAALDELYEGSGERA